MEGVINEQGKETWDIKQWAEEKVREKVSLPPLGQTINVSPHGEHWSLLSTPAAHTPASDSPTHTHPHTRPDKMP